MKIYNFFQELLGRNGVKTEEIDEYNVDFMHWYKGRTPCVLFPTNSQQVSAILRYCYERKLAIVPQAGNTGLVGGSTPVHDELVLSTKRIAKNFHFDAASGILDCDSGFILEEVDNRLATDGYMVPVDLGAKGSCLMGGIVATNAGGIRLLRYGSMHANVTGLDVVLADKDGTHLRLGSSVRKDNTELHLHKLFIGSEGQLGVITGVSMQAVPRPLAVFSALIGVNSFAKCLELLRLGKQMLNEILSSFELIDGEAMKMVAENAQLQCPLNSNSPFYLLIETSGSDPQHDSAKMDRFLSNSLESGLADDGVLAKNAAEAAHLWKIRENCSLALRVDGYVFKHDLSLPLKHFYELTDVVRERLGQKAKRVVTFGHIGDGNTHLNVTVPEYDQAVYDLLYPFIYEWVVAKGGSISAEHGIGRLKRLYHHKLVDPRKQRISSQLKHLFDPRGILSPYKMIDPITE